MAAVSSPGIGSGLDVKTIVPQLVAIERQPIDLLNAQTTDLQAKLAKAGLLEDNSSGAAVLARFKAKAAPALPAPAVTPALPAPSLSSPDKVG